MESGKEKDQAIICHEGDVEGQNHYEKECQVCHEWETDSHSAEQSLFSQHVLCLLGQRKPILGDGFA